MSGLRSVADIVRRNAEQEPSGVALLCGDDTVTWQQLDERTNQVAHLLNGLGIGAGDRVGLLDRNSLEHFDLFFGAAKVGAVCIDLNWRLTPTELTYIVNDADIRVLVVHDEFARSYEAIRPDLRTAPIELSVPGQAERSFGRSRDEQPTVPVHHSPQPDDVVIHMYSSGTTGRPKGVLLTNRSILFALETFGSLWDVREDSVGLSFLPFFHIAGGGFAMAFMNKCGSSVVMRDASPGGILDAVEAHHATHFCAVPALLQFMCAEPGVDSRDLSSMQIIVYGASPISPATLRRAMEVFPARFLQGYGLTETCGGATFLAPEDHVLDGPRSELLRSAGRAAPGTEVGIFDSATGEPRATGDVGEIWIRGPHVMAGYWQDPEATDEAVTHQGWFKSGDAGYLSDDGYLFIQDRVKDMIVSGGENVYPAEVEAVLLSHPDIADCAVIGIPHERWGEVPLALVVLRAGTPLTETDIVEHCRNQLARYKCPASVEWTDELPRNPSGKVLKRLLRERYWHGRERSVN